MALEYILNAATLDLDDKAENLLETLTDAHARDDLAPAVPFAVTNEYLTATAYYSSNFRIGQVAGRPFVGGATITFRLNKVKHDQAVIEMLRCLNELLLYTDSDLLFYFIESTEAHLARLQGRLYLHQDGHPRGFWKLGEHKRMI